MTTFNQLDTEGFDSFIKKSTNRPIMGWKLSSAIVLYSLMFIINNLYSKLLKQSHCLRTNNICQLLCFLNKCFYIFIYNCYFIFSRKYNLTQSAGSLLNQGSDVGIFFVGGKSTIVKVKAKVNVLFKFN